jgi:hypothetical protein
MFFLFIGLSANDSTSVLEPRRLTIPNPALLKGVLLIRLLRRLM